MSKDSPHDRRMGLFLEEIRKLKVTAPEMKLPASGAKSTPRLTKTSARARENLSAASGVALVDDRVYVACDDENFLGIFPLRSATIVGERFPLSEKRLPSKKTARKKVKADWEALLHLPPEKGLTEGALLTLPSGSKPNRVTGNLVAFRDHRFGEKSAEYLERALSSESNEQIDFSALYKKLSRKIPDLNIEGAVMTADECVLLHRGNSGSAKNAIIRLDKKSVLKNLLENQVFDGKVKKVQAVKLPKKEGVRFSFTDAALDAKGRFWFLAVAEDTESAFLDGAYLGAMIGELDPKKAKVGQSWELFCPFKPEGLFFSGERAGEFYLVTDADSRRTAARLFRGKLPKGASKKLVKKLAKKSAKKSSKKSSKKYSKKAAKKSGKKSAKRLF